jgi:LmbE family N-acetylglucosaminyl deacetylase
MHGLATNGIERVLCIGAHSDDIEIGAGGTVMSLLAANPKLEVRWVVFGARGKRANEARASAAQFLAGCKNARIDLFEFRDGFMPYIGTEVKERFETLKDAPAPDLILTHHREDLHQDHRLLAELTWNTFRDHWVLEYEVPKYDGGLTSPNVFVALTDAIAQRKIEILMSVFASQHSRRWFNPENFEALLRLRGLESNSESGLAEGFHCAKLRLLTGLAPATPRAEKGSKRAVRRR